MKKVLLVMSIVFVLTFAMATVAYATGASPAPAPTNSVSQVINDAFGEVKTQAENIIFNVVVWSLRVIGIVVLLVFIVLAGISHRKHESINFAPLVIIFIVLLLLFILPEALWALV